MAACGRKSTLMISWSGRNQATGVSGDECGVAAEERGCVELDIHPVHNAVAIHVVSEVERIESGVGVGGGHELALTLRNSMGTPMLPAAALARAREIPLSVN